MNRHRFHRRLRCGRQTDCGEAVRAAVRRRPRRRRSWSLVLLLLALSLAFAAPAAALSINLIFDSDATDTPSFDPDGTSLTVILRAAADRWEDIIQDSGTLDINYYYDNLSGGTLASHTNQNTSGGKPTEAKIRFDTILDGAERNWYFDPTPDNHSEYDLSQTLYRDLDTTDQADWFNGSPPDLLEVGYRGDLSATAPTAATGAYDLFSTAIHELGHAVGLTSNVAASEISDGDYDVASNLVGGATMAIEGDTHIDARIALMCSGCGSIDVRRMPSATDIFAAATASGWTDIDLPRQDFLTGDNWNTDGNWEGNQVPGSADDAWVRHGGNVNLSANGRVENLTVAEGSFIFTGGHKLTVDDDLIIGDDGGTVGGVSVLDSAGELDVQALRILDNGYVALLNGGLVDAVTFTIEDGGSLNAAGTIDVASQLNNHGTISTWASGGLTLTTTSSAAVWDLDGSGAGKVNVSLGDLHVTGELLDAFDGEMTVGKTLLGVVGHTATFVDGWELGTGGDLTMYGDDDDPAQIAGGTFIVAGDVEVNGVGQFQADVTFESTTDITLTDADDVLSLYGATTYDGGDYIGDGKLVQNGDAIVSGDTTIDVATFDMDGTSGTSALTITGATLTLNSSLIEDIAAVNAYDGDLTVFGGSLVVNTDDDWRLDGTMTLIAGTVSGQDLTVANGGSLVAGAFLSGADSTIDAAVTFQAGSSTTVVTDCELDLTGAIVYDSGSFDGDGTLIQNNNAQVTGDTTISTATFDWDGGNGDSTTTVDAGVTLTIDSDAVDRSANNDFDGTLHVGSGATVTVNTATDWRLDGELNFTNSGAIPHLGGSATMIVQGDVNVSGGEADIDAPVQFDTAADVTVAAGAELEVNGAATVNGGTYNLDDGTLDFDSTLSIGSTTFNDVGVADTAEVFFDGITTYTGGTIGSSAIITQRGAATINGATVINGSVVNLDGDGTTTVTLNDDLTINADSLENSSNKFDGTLTINGRSNELTVNTVSPWVMDGTLEITTSYTTTYPAISGQDFTLSGPANIDGGTRFDARVDIDSSGSINFQTGTSRINLNGGDLVDTNTISGGSVSGPAGSSLRSTSSSALVGYGTINTDVDFLPGTALLADNGTLAIDGSFISLGQIGTNDSDGTLDVVDAWNTDTADELRLNGGEVTGGGITNDGTTIGHGLVTSSSFVNNSTLTADGGTLTLNTGIFPDLDGSSETGTVNALDGSVEVLNAATGNFIFNGTLNVGVGQMFSSSARGLVNDGVVNLTNGTVAVSDFSQDAQLNVSAGGTSRLESPGIDFRWSSTSTVEDDLEVVGDTDIFAGAMLTGSGRLVVPVGSLLTLLDGATVGIEIENNGQISVGASPGFATIDTFTQTVGGEWKVDLGGTLAGTEHDQLDITNTATLAGILDVSLIGGFSPVAGDRFDIISAGLITGVFDTLNLPVLSSSLVWDLADLYTTGELLVSLSPLASDFDEDGDVDGFDFLTWQRGGSPTPLSSGDLSDWQTNYGTVAPLSAASAVVPEPSALLLGLMASLAGISRRRRR